MRTSFWPQAAGLERIATSTKQIHADLDRSKRRERRGLAAELCLESCSWKRPIGGRVPAPSFPSLSCVRLHGLGFSRETDPHRSKRREQRALAVELCLESSRWKSRGGRAPMPSFPSLAFVRPRGVMRTNRADLLQLFERDFN